MRESVGYVTPLTITTHAESDSDRERGKGGGVTVRSPDVHCTVYTTHAESGRGEY